MVIMPGVVITQRSQVNQSAEQAAQVVERPVLEVLHNAGDLRVEVLKAFWVLVLARGRKIHL
jgi:hypothetical protein